MNEEDFVNRLIADYEIYGWDPLWRVSAAAEVYLYGGSTLRYRVAMYNLYFPEFGVYVAKDKLFKIITINYEIIAVEAYPNFIHT